MWGWRALSKHEPFDQGVGYGEIVDGMKVRKVLVLMTDGMNTKSPIYPSQDPINPSHDGSDAALANTLTAELCTNIKAKGIAIYSVAFEVPDDSIKDILRDVRQRRRQVLRRPGSLDSSSRRSPISAPISLRSDRPLGVRFAGKPVPTFPEAR